MKRIRQVGGLEHLAEAFLSLQLSACSLEPAAVQRPEELAGGVWGVKWCPGGFFDGCKLR